MTKLLTWLVVVLAGAMLYGLAGCGDPYGLDGYTDCATLRAKQAAVLRVNPDVGLVDGIEKRMVELGC
jgi:hypothetical protein